LSPLRILRLGANNQAKGVSVPTSSSIHSSSRPLERDPRKDLLGQIKAALIGSSDLVPLTDARYLETHGIYEGRSDQQPLIIDWFADRIAATRPRKGAFRVLSIGCGSGILDVQIATRLQAQIQDWHCDLHYVGVDPNPVECEAFEQNFENAALDQVNVEVVNTTFEDLEAGRGFDYVHFVHSLYYMPDPKAALEKARKLLAPGGRLIVFHAPCEALNELTVCFWDKHYARQMLFAEDFVEILDAWQWDYERARFDAQLEVSQLTQTDSSIGLALTDFIVQVDSTRLSAPVQELVARYLRLVSVDSVEEHGKTHISHPVDVFVIAG
jgi:SAM-dependent methyltransferase